MLTALMGAAALVALVAPWAADKARRLGVAGPERYRPAAESSGHAAGPAPAVVPPPPPPPAVDPTPPAPPAPPPPPPLPTPPPIPPPPPPPPPIPAAPGPDPAVQAVAQGSKALAAVLAASPAAPLAPIVSLLGAILAPMINEAARAREAFARLRRVRDLALQHANYEGYMAEHQAGVALWQAGYFEPARARFDKAKAAGWARRNEVAAQLDAYEVGAYRAHMAKKPGFLKSRSGHLADAWGNGEAGITGYPLVLISAIDKKTDGEWVYRFESTGETYRFGPDPSHPDWNGTLIPKQPYDPEKVRQEMERRAEVAFRATQEENTGLSPGGFMSDRKFGSGRDAYLAERELMEDAAPRPVRATPPPAPPPPPPPAPKPPPPPPAPPPPPPSPKAVPLPKTVQIERQLDRASGPKGRAALDEF